MNLKFLENCFNEGIDREMSNIVDTVEDRIQNTILTAIENIIAPKIELVVRLVNASSRRDMASRITESEREERVGMTAPFENASGNNDRFYVSNMNDEARSNIPGEVSELSVPESRFNRQSHTCHMVTSLSNATHHIVTGQTTQTIKSLSSLLGAIQHHAIHHHTNIRTCRHKYHKTQNYIWLNKK